MTSTEEVVKKEVIAQAKEDYLGLWQFISMIEAHDPKSTRSERRRLAVKIVRDLLQQGLLRAGSSDGVKFWPWEGTTEQIIQRIEQEWSKLKHEPNIAEVVWFDLVEQK